jgi:hypothetical protein
MFLWPPEHCRGFSRVSQRGPHVRIPTFVIALFVVGPGGVIVSGCQRSAVSRAPADSPPRATPSPGDVAVRRPSAETVVTRLYSDLVDGRGQEHREDLYDPGDELALAMLDGTPKLRDGTKRLRVLSAKELGDCAAVVTAATENGSDTAFVTYAVQKDGAWKLILPAGNYRPRQTDRYPWTDEQRRRFEELRQWADATAGVK